MPELPEVETVRRGLANLIEGRSLNNIQCNRKDIRFPMREGLADLAQGQKVTHVGRRGKYIILELDGAKRILIHLGMSGRLILGTDIMADEQFYQRQQINPRHNHVIMSFSDAAVIYNDSRRFGMVDLLDDDGGHYLLDNLGPEPLGNEFDGDWLATRLTGSKSSIKEKLLDQRLVVGIGNIYASESLHLAGINPKRRAGNISLARLHDLAEAIRTTLQNAIEAGGSSLRDYRDVRGAPGYFQHQFAVYDRAGEMCRRCDNSPIRKAVQSGRSTYYCVTCQR